MCRSDLFISNIKVNNIKRYYVAKISFSVINIKILKLLYLEGFIRGYKKLDNKKIVVYLKYKRDFSLIDKIKYVKRNNFFNFFNVESIKYFFGVKQFVLFSTSFGILSNKSCIEWNIGGKLLLIV